jgi:hypothetical protein
MRHLKEQQTAKIEQIRRALFEEGVYGLNQQAGVLGLPRSTAWTVITASHKNSGLSIKTVKRMLSSSTLPMKVRAILDEYVDEKSRGWYGHDMKASKRFVAQL